jgi:hypothetical protein
MAIAKMSVAELEKFLHVEFPQAFAAATSRSKAPTAILPAAPTLQRAHAAAGRHGVGPTLMALADCAMYVVLLSAIGPVGLAVTTNLNINFLRKGSPGRTCLRERGS